jgi:hypothetical protein
VFAVPGPPATTVVTVWTAARPQTRPVAVAKVAPAPLVWFVMSPAPVRYVARPQANPAAWVARAAQGSLVTVATHAWCVVLPHSPVVGVQAVFVGPEQHVLLQAAALHVEHLHSPVVGVWAALVLLEPHAIAAAYAFRVVT